MIDIKTGTETFVAYAFNVAGFVGKITSDTVQGVLNIAPVWGDLARLDIYVDNHAVQGLWVGTYDLTTAVWTSTNPQVGELVAAVAR
jgi:hypothetical protein